MISFSQNPILGVQTVSSFREAHQLRKLPTSIDGFPGGKNNFSMGWVAARGHPIRGSGLTSSYGTVLRARRPVWSGRSLTRCGLASLTPTRFRLQLGRLGAAEIPLPGGPLTATQQPIEKFFGKPNCGCPDGLFPPGSPSLEGGARSQLMGFPEGGGRFGPASCGFENNLYMCWVAARGPTATTVRGSALTSSYGARRPGWSCQL